MTRRMSWRWKEDNRWGLSKPVKVEGVILYLPLGEYSAGGDESWSSTLTIVLEPEPLHQEKPN